MISVIIPNYNGREYLEALLPTIEEQSRGDFDVTVVDNGSTDGSADFLESRGVRVIPLGENRGFAAACNRGALETKGEAIFFLNSDTLLDRRCMQVLAKALDDYPRYGFFAPMMVRMEDRDLLDGAGDMMPADGRPIRRGAGMHSSVRPDPEIVAPCGGAALWRRELFESLGGFDEEFFAYLEDVDLGLRARLAGSTGRYVPEAVVYHLGAGVHRKDMVSSRRAVFDNPVTVRLTARNKIRLWAKCLPGPVLLRHAPSMAMGLVKSAAHHTFRSGMGGAFIAGTIEGVMGLPAVMNKRREIQSSKAATNRQVERWIKTASRW